MPEKRVKVLEKKYKKIWNEIIKALYLQYQNKNKMKAIYDYNTDKFTLELTTREMDILNSAMIIAYKLAYKTHYPDENKLREEIYKVVIEPHNYLDNE